MISIERIDKVLISKYYELSKSEYAKDNLVCNEGHLIWKYLNNPAGYSQGIHAYHNNELIGRLAAQKKRCRMYGEPVLASNLTDLLIRKDKRSLKCFLDITKNVFEKYELGEEKFAIMCPNDVSINLYKKVYGLKKEESQEIKVIPINFSGMINDERIKAISKPFSIIYFYGLRKVISIIDKCLEFTLRETCDEQSYKSLLKYYYSNECIEFSRDWDWHQWRFSDESGIKYTKKYLYKGKSLVGVIILREVEYKETKILIVVDLIIQRRNNLAALKLLLTSIKIAYKSDSSCVIFIGLGLKKTSLVFYNLMLRVPNILRPFEIEHYAIGLSSETVKSNWRLTMADYDIF